MPQHSLVVKNAPSCEPNIPVWAVLRGELQIAALYRHSRGQGLHWGMGMLRTTVCIP